MVSRLKICTMAVGLVLGLAGCAQDLAKINQDLASFNRALASGGGAQAGGFAMAVQPEAGQQKQVQLVVPNDKRTAAAMDEALPVIKKVLGIQQCVRESSSLRLTNVYAVPGVDMSSVNGGWFPNQNQFMRYHDKNKCVSVRTLDQWTMPALNAIQFRIVFFADDSGETVNFQSLYKKMDDGSWKVAAFHTTN